MRKSRSPLLLSGGLLLLSFAWLAFSGCSGAPAKAAAPKEEAAAEEKGHGKAETEKSDLDRPLAELFAEVCEHKIPMYQCAECRYEVGVVKVAKNLLTGGLLATTTAVTRPGSAALLLSGEIALDARRVAELSPLVPGIVAKILVDLGQPVKAGQGLLAIKSVDLAQAEGDFLEAESREKLARKTHERQKSLREAGVNAERELLAAEQEWAGAQIRVDAARQKLSGLGLTEAEIKVLLANGQKGASGELVIRAPLAGLVLELQARTGELKSPGDKMLRVGDVSELAVMVDLYERDLPGLVALKAAGPIPVTVAVSAFAGETFPGRLDFIGALMDEKKRRTVKARIHLANPNGKLRPGLFATVSVALPGQKESVAVPSGAVLSDAGRDFVFIHQQGDYYVRRPVVKGAEHNGLTDISLGLEAGQTVVTQGAFLLKSDVLRSKMGAGCAD